MGHYRLGCANIQIKTENPPDPLHKFQLQQKDATISELQMKCIRINRLYQDLQPQFKKCQEEKDALQEKLSKSEELVREKSETCEELTIKNKLREQNLLKLEKCAEEKETRIAELEKMLKAAKKELYSTSLDMTEAIDIREKKILAMTIENRDIKEELFQLEEQLHERMCHFKQPIEYRLRYLALTPEEQDKISSLAENRVKLMEAQNIIGEQSKFVAKMEEKHGMVKQLTEELHECKQELHRSADLRKMVKAKDAIIKELESQLENSASTVKELESGIISMLADEILKDSHIKDSDCELGNLQKKVINLNHEILALNAVGIIHEKFVEEIKRLLKYDEDDTSDVPEVRLKKLLHHVKKIYDSSSSSSQLRKNEEPLSSLVIDQLPERTEHGNDDKENNPEGSVRGQRRGRMQNQPLLQEKTNNNVQLLPINNPPAKKIRMEIPLASSTPTPEASQPEIESFINELAQKKMEKKKPHLATCEEKQGMKTMPLQNAKLKVDDDANMIKKKESHGSITIDVTNLTQTLKREAEEESDELVDVEAF